MSEKAIPFLGVTDDSNVTVHPLNLHEVPGSDTGLTKIIAWTKPTIPIFEYTLFRVLPDGTRKLISNSFDPNKTTWKTSYKIGDKFGVAALSLVAIDEITL